MSEKEKKVTTYEYHVNEVLKPRLSEHMMIRDKVIEEQAEYLRSGDFCLAFCVSTQMPAKRSLLKTATNFFSPFVAKLL